MAEKVLDILINCKVAKTIDYLAKSKEPVSSSELQGQLNIYGHEMESVIGYLSTIDFIEAENGKIKLTEKGSKFHEKLEEATRK
jgi:predicted transcriptional regulator